MSEQLRIWIQRMTIIEYFGKGLQNASPVDINQAIES